MATKIEGTNRKHTFIYGLVPSGEELVSSNVRYVGKANDLKDRLQCHLSKSRNSTSSLYNSILHKWLRGNPDVQIIELEKCLLSDWQERELFWIKKLRVHNLLLNIVVHKAGLGEHSLQARQNISNGQMGHKVSQKTRDRISIKLMGHVGAFLGKKHSEESRKKISLSHKGKVISRKTRSMISASLKGRVSPLKGKPLSDEHRKKLSEARKKYFLNKA